MKHVLLLHGLWDTSRVFRKFSGYLHEHGFQTHAPDLPIYSGLNRIETIAEFVRNEADRHLPESFDIIGFSMGGLIGRYYIQKLGGHRRVRNFITLSTPHHGTLSALGLAFLPGIRQMLPGSSFLKRLNSDAGHLPRFTSIWMPLDLMIVPSVSSRIPALAEDVAVPCWLHRLMPVYPRVWQTALAVLQESEG